MQNMFPSVQVKKLAKRTSARSFWPVHSGKLTSRKPGGQTAGYQMIAGINPIVREALSEALYKKWRSQYEE